MNRETAPRQDPARDPVHVPDGADLLTETDVENTLPEPIDADWPEREHAAKPAVRGHGSPDDGDNDASSYGEGVDAEGDKVRDEGVLESLGKAVSEPLREAIEAAEAGEAEEARQHRPLREED